MPTVKLSNTDLIVEAAEAVRFDRFPDWSIDQLLYHPREAISLCIEVRSRTDCKIASWPDCEILRALTNARKQSRTRKTGRESRPRSRRKT
jgi:hypothetical protein